MCVTGLHLIFLLFFYPLLCILLWEILGESNINNTLIKALQNLNGNTAQVKIGKKNYPTLLTLLKDCARDVAFSLHFLRFT
jgi:hypothetical protein